MLKRKIDSYIKHFYADTNKALLLTGARQTGKTFSIREFGKTFKSFIEINFIENPEAIEAFKGTVGMRCRSALRLSLPLNSWWKKARTVIYSVALCWEWNLRICVLNL